ncbi:MAG TPA: hypothetical protein PL151_02295 [Phycisphaerae bacterium]|nr:hypothetical protein [Phycisphaerae bacterium]HOJ75946.1 hypothetical protein [Phycisphaerae bacterium]HOM53378.1 hypothetical protein [Phycisphaerae bacterium]HON66111.1 hypothetical protein [Phycisphaerae bacterium]HOQ84465.1 hypothetical protein [Phycisphaerae bacterium]
MDKKYSIALVVILFGAAGGLYYWRSADLNDYGTRRNYNASLHCTSCNKDFLAELDVADTPPVECPNCGKMTGWYRWECAKCNEQFTPPASGNPPRQPVAPSCPKCGSSATGRMGGEL